jgi:hypothetical protein
MLGLDLGCGVPDFVAWAWAADGVVSAHLLLFLFYRGCQGVVVVGDGASAAIRTEEGDQDRSRWLRDDKQIAAFASRLVVERTGFDPVDDSNDQVGRCADGHVSKEASPGELVQRR